MTFNIAISVVIEMDTKNISGGIYDYHSSIREWVRQADASNARCEIIIVSSDDCSVLEQLTSGQTQVRTACAAGASYYALKNTGANLAVGEIVYFTDSDCRPGNNIIESIIEAFKDSPSQCVAGRSFYDGDDLLSRINTTLSFGYLHQGGKILNESCALAHNVAIRRSSYAEDPFGPFNGRVGGDAYLTNHYRTMGPVPLARDIMVYHENPTFNLRGMLDRHLREIFDALKRYRKNDKWPGTVSGLAYVLKILWKRPKQKFRTLKKYGRSLEVKTAHYPVAFVQLALYQLIDSIVVMLVFLPPRIREKWIAYQFGPDYPYDLLQKTGASPVNARANAG
jgi:glycosyltransferase involved in cell wall biosynthesis